VRIVKELEEVKEAKEVKDVKENARAAEWRGAGENDRVGVSESKKILPHDYDPCQEKVVSANV